MLLDGIMRFLSGPVDTVLKHFLPDPAEREKATTQILAMVMAADLAQVEINKVEAASGNIFKSGWRPCIGWVCAGALTLQFFVFPLASWGFQTAGVIVPALPTFDDVLWELMFGLLGMGALRSFDKIKGRKR